ncbi:MAG: T9SS type A sorting domain-containing protein [candidate division KSB1 bacterium]|nr:T9SS type A sorting domain-containing protein [candidate division KSB1 bacterium]MDZ7334393.1 T9SS type A sorting domain-containing protein [candidate division KSB1 bacterium]
MNEFQIIGHHDSWQAKSYATVLNDGGIVVCWEDWGRDGQYYGIFGKYYLAKPIIHLLRHYSLIEPLFDATLGTNKPTFRWQQPSSIRECYPWELTFDLYIDTDSNFPNPKIIKNIQDTTYTIDSFAAGKTYFWKVLAKNLAGDSLWSKQQDWGFFIKHGATSMETGEQYLPSGFELFQNYPNPFNSSTTIKYQLPVATDVKLEIYNFLGQRIRTLVDQFQQLGSYSIIWDGTDDFNQSVSSGVYLYQLKTKNFIKTNKLIVLR